MKIDRKKAALLMADAQLTQAALAKKAGLTAKTIGNLIHGGRNAYPITVGKIAAALGVRLADLMEGNDENE